MLPSMASLLALVLQTFLGAAQQIVLDDMDTALNITSANAFEGTFEPCLSDAYNGQFHHDWGRNKGEASFTIGFQPPRSGCYAVEEHHPGSDFSCRRYLPQNVSLTVDYCRGLSKTIYYDQSSSATAGKWNTLGQWMFFEGWSGALTVRNHVHEACAAGQCFMVVDAFRLTRIGDTCSGATASAPSPMVPPVLEHEGLLTLQVVGASRDSLWDLRGTISDALEIHFGMEQVSILSLGAASGRRLSGADAMSFEARFTGQGQASEVPATGNLAAVLQASLDAAGSTALVASAEVDWVAAYPSGPADADPGERSAARDPEPTSILVWVMVCVPILVVACGAGLALCACRWKSAGKGAVDVEAPPEQPFDAANPPESDKWAEAPPGKPLDAANPPEGDKWDTISVSTGPPESESNSSERPSTTETVEPVGVVDTRA